jgi:hypothetical protein
MATTYEPIATTTLGSAAASITFSSIAATYTDLKVVLISSTATAGNTVNYLRFNSDTGTNYSSTWLTGDGATVGSSTETGATFIRGGENANNTDTGLSFITHDVFSYAGSTYKTALVTNSRDNNGSGSTYRIVGLWRSTSAITSLTIASSAGNYKTGTTATLYGIKNA